VAERELAVQEKEEGIDGMLECERNKLSSRETNLNTR
jgi:hypothetical protein